MDRSKFSNGGRPYFVAEMNSSHNGHVETAKQMIDAAVRAGCDAVKFQSWSANSLYSETYYRQNPIAKRMVSRFALDDDKLRLLADYCRETYWTVREEGLEKKKSSFSRGESQPKGRMGRLLERFWCTASCAPKSVRDAKRCET